MGQQRRQPQDCSSYGSARGLWKAPKHRSVTEVRLHIRSRHLDTLVFGVASNKVYKQVYDLTKVDESNKAPMMTISKGDEKSDLHTVHREFAYSTKKKTPRQNARYQLHTLAKTKRIQPEENLVDFSSSQKDASGVGTLTKDQQVALPKISKESTVARPAITKGCVCSNAFQRFTRL